MKIRITTAIFFVFGLFIYTSAAHAQTPACQPVFGGGQTCVQNRNFTLDKQVKEPDTNTFRDQLSANGKRFTPGQTVTFRLIVKNISNRALEKFIVSDKLPANLTFVKGDGTYDAATGTFTSTIDRIDKNQSKTVQLTASINRNLPSSPAPLCINNAAKATQGDNEATDNALFCITNTGVTGGTTVQPTPRQIGSTRGTNDAQSKGGQQVYPQPTQKRTPDTGPELLALAGLLPAGLGGLYLRRKTARS